MLLSHPSVRGWPRIAALLVGACSLLMTPAWSQSNPTQTEPIAETPLEQLGNVRVYSASKHMQTITDAPSFVTVITGDQIRKFGYRTLAEVLQSVSGFYVDYDRNYSYVGVRGFSRPGDFNSRILVLLDGHRMNENLYDGAYVGTEFPLDLALVERIEISRGASASLYGTNAFFAVVNVVTVSPEQRKGVEVSFDAASFGTFSGSTRFGVDLPAHTRLLVSGTVYESAGPSPLYFPALDSPDTHHGIADHVDDDSFRTLMVTLARENLRVQSFYSERTKGIPTGSYGTILSDPRNRTLDRRGYLDAEYNRALSDHWNIAARSYFDYYGYKGTYVYAADSGDAEIEKDYCLGTWWGSELKAALTSWRKHSVTMGSEVRVNLRQDQGAYIAGGTVPEFQESRDSNIWAVYFQDEYAVIKPLVLYLGIRHDEYSQFGGTTNPRLGVVYRPWINTAFKLMYGTAFRAPNAWELYYNAFGYLRNPSLKPEQVRTIEVIAEHSIAGRIRVTGSVFSNRITQLIDRDQNPDGTLIFRNLGKVSAQGLEAQMEANWHDEFQARLSYTFQQTRDERTGSALSNSPKHLAKLNLIAPLKRGRLFANLEAQYTARRSTDELEPVPGYTVVNLTAFAPRLAHNFDFSFSVFNLFNRRYFSAESDPTIPPVIQDGRTARVKLTYRF